MGKAKRTSLRDLFELLNSSELTRYCVLYNWDCMPAQPKNEKPVLLVESIRGFKQVLGDSFVKHGTNTFKFLITDGEFVAYVIEKGCGVLPSTFESTLLSTRIKQHDLIFCPDDDRAFWTALYRAAVHDDKFSGRDKEAIRRRLRDVCGEVRSKNPPSLREDE